MRAAVLHEHRRPFAIEELDLAPPGPAEVEVRLHASGVCRSDWSTVTGDTPSPLPAVLGHEGAGVVERVGPGVSTRWRRETTSCSRGSRTAVAARTARAGGSTLCDVAAPALLAGTLLDGTTRLSLDGRPVHHYSFLSTFAERTVVPEASCVRIRRRRAASRSPRSSAAPSRPASARSSTGPGWRREAHWPSSGAGGVGLSAVQAGVLSGAGTSSPSTRRRRAERWRSSWAPRTRSTPAPATPPRPCGS